VAALFLRRRSAGYVLPICKSSDATRGPRLYAWWNAPRACRLRQAHHGAMQKRDGRAVDGTKRKTESHRDECTLGDGRACRPRPEEEEHRQQHERESEEMRRRHFRARRSLPHSPHVRRPRRRHEQEVYRAQSEDREDVRRVDDERIAANGEDQDRAEDVHDPVEARQAKQPVHGASRQATERRPRPCALC